MIRVTSLSEEEIEEIGEAFADFSYADGERGMALFYKDRDSLKEYICGFVRAMLKGGVLYSTSESHEAFIAFRYSKDKLPLSADTELIKAIFATLGPGGAIRMLKSIKSGGRSYEDSFKKTKKPYIFVGMLAVRREYQGQGYMRQALDIAFKEGQKRNCPVILETDAVLKRDKYVHIGMNNVRTRQIGEGVVCHAK